MKAFLLAAVTLLSLSAKAQLQSDYYDIRDVKVEEVQDDLSTFDQPGLGQDCNASEKPIVGLLSGSGVAGEALDQINVIIDQITNIGKKIWNIVLAGQPVVNVKFDTANALPQGLKCWMDLGAWSVPTSKTYKVSYTNGWGVNVVSYTYRVTATTGGSLNGVGKYITNATMSAANLDVAWGFTFNSQALVPSVFNTATRENPVAGMQMVMKWSVDTAIKHNQMEDTFFVGGDGRLVKMQ